MDSYKVFRINSLKKVQTSVHFLKPICYNEYSTMNSAQIAEQVKHQIEMVLKGHADAYA